MQSFEDRDKVEPAGHAGAGCVRDGESDPAGHTSLLGVAAGCGDHVGIQVEPFDPDQGVGLSHRDA